jgi:hypothetical protein
MAEGANQPGRVLQALFFEASHQYIQTERLFASHHAH